MYRHTNTFVAVVLAIVVASACSKNSPTSPTTTPAPAATVSSVAITGTNAIDVGAQTSLRATATKSDGSTEDVTATAAWQTSNPAVATVSSGGAVRALTAGATAVSATFGGQTGQLDLQVNAVDDVQRVVLRLTSLVIDGTCDDNNIFEDSVDGEFEFRFTLTRDGGTTTIWSSGRTALTKGAHSRSQSQTFNRNVTQGEDFLVQFEGTEFDGLLGADPRMNGRSRNFSHVYSGGSWSGGRSLSLGNSACGATMNYTITSAPQ